MPPFAAFPDLLAEILEKRQMSLRSFARSTGVPVSLLSRIKTGSRSVPSSRIEQWANLLGLVGDERTRFIDSALWTSVPSRLRPWLEKRLPPPPAGNSTRTGSESA